jgi:archaellum component FlaC
MNGLEEEVERLKKEIESLRTSMDNKTAEIQYLEAVNRGKW